MGRRAAIIAICAAVSSEACFFPVVVRGDLQGTIVDEESGAPIAGATVCVETWAVGGLPMIVPAELHDAIVVLTDADGRYSVEKTREWHFTLIFPDAGPAWFPRIIVSHPGYQNRVIDGWRPYWWRGMPEPITLIPTATEPPSLACPTARTVDELPPESRASG